MFIPKAIRDLFRLATSPVLNTQCVSIPKGCDSQRSKVVHDSKHRRVTVHYRKHRKIKL